MLTILHDFGRFFLVGTYPDGPIGGVVLTIIIAITCLALTFPCALVVALARTSRIKMLRGIFTCYVYAVRGLPLLFLLLWIYFLMPYVIGHPITSFWTLVISIVIYQTAYLSEVIRGGIEALPAGQIAAARALGLSYWLITRKIVLPQALYNVLPGIVNQLTIIIKESSLGYVIALSELTYVSSRVNTFLLTEALQVYSILAGIYFLLCFAISMAVAALERRVHKRRQGTDTTVPVLIEGEA